MNIIDVMNGDNISIDGVTTNKVAHYNGENVTCYPGSNQRDDGKLHLEFNMARFVTRLSSKNFCIVKPSFTLNIVTDQSTGTPQIEISPGQASINGMDLIVTEQMYLNPPVTPGTYYIALRLGRDSSSNVLGDTIIGVLTRFDGVYLAYWDEKEDPANVDMLYLGKVTWSGTSFSNLEEDEDKYGRLWAEDILGKFLDPKHPDTRRLNLQELIYNLPDWYFSKEGDTVYGPIAIADNRDNGNIGILMNVDDTGSYITMKNPAEDNTSLQFYGDVDRSGVIDQADYDMIEAFVNGTGTLSDLQQKLADVNHDGVIDEKDLKYIQNFLDYQAYLDDLLPGERAKTPIEMDLNFGDIGNPYFIDNTTNQINLISNSTTKRMEIDKATLYVNKVTDYSFHIHNEDDICLDSEKDINIEAENQIKLTTEAQDSPVLLLDNSEVSITDPDYPDLSFKYKMYTNSSTNIAEYTMGAAIWRYTYTSSIGGGRVSLLDQNVLYLDVVPNADFSKNARVQQAIYVGRSTAYAGETTYIKPQEIKVGSTSDTNVYTIITPKKVVIHTNKDGMAGDNLDAILTISGQNSYTNIYETGVISLANKTTNGTLPAVFFQDNNNESSIRFQKVRGVKALDLNGQLNLTNLIANGKVCSTDGFVFGSSINSTPTLTNSSGTIVSSGAFKVGTNGSSQLTAGRTFITHQNASNPSESALIVTGGTKLDGTVTGTGNWTTTGTITGSKVYNAVYNDYAEIFRKPQNEEIEPGYAVCVGQDGLVHKVNSSDDINTIIGISSDTAGVLLGGKDIPEDEQVVVGMVGQLWTKTNDEFLTPGMMVKVNADGTVSKTNNRTERFGITLTNIKDGKVKIVFNG